MNFPLSALSLAIVASTFAVACGGSILDDSHDAGLVMLDANGAAPDAGGTEPSDAASPDAANPEAGCGDVAALLDAWSSPSWDGGGHVFTRKDDFIDFFQTLARSNDLVVAAHDVDCSPAGVGAGECTYDPTTARIDATDVHYSGPFNELTGPDGAPWVWLYVVDRNEWLAASDAQAPAAYQFLVLANECAAQ